MGSPSLLGDPIDIRGVPASTSTACLIQIAAGTDTGVVASTATRALDLSKPFGYSSTGGKPLNSTVNPEVTKGPPRIHSIGISVPMELVFHSSGKSIHVAIAHKHRSATSGAGSTWATIETETFRYKMGTSTDATIFVSADSFVPTQAIKRYYTADITVSRLKATSTSAADTSTDTSVTIVAPVYLVKEASRPARLNKV